MSTCTVLTRVGIREKSPPARWFAAGPPRSDLWSRFPGQVLKPFSHLRGPPRRAGKCIEYPGQLEVPRCLSSPFSAKYRIVSVGFDEAECPVFAVVEVRQGPSQFALLLLVQNQTRISHHRRCCRGSDYFLFPIRPGGPKFCELKMFVGIVFLPREVCRPKSQ